MKIDASVLDSHPRISLREGRKGVFIHGQFHPVLPMDYKVLWLLMSHDIVTREQIEEALWPGWTIRPLAYLECIKVSVSRLRKVLLPTVWRIERVTHDPAHYKLHQVQ